MRLKMKLGILLLLSAFSLSSIQAEAAGAFARCKISNLQDITPNQEYKIDRKQNTRLSGWMDTVNIDFSEATKLAKNNKARLKDPYTLSLRKGISGEIIATFTLKKMMMRQERGGKINPAYGTSNYRFRITYKDDRNSLHMRGFGQEFMREIDISLGRLDENSLQSGSMTIYHDGQSAATGDLNCERIKQ